MTPEEKRALAINERMRVEQIKLEYPSASNAKRKLLIKELKGMQTLETSDLIKEIEQAIITREEFRNLNLTSDEKRRREMRDRTRDGMGFDFN